MTIQANSALFSDLSEHDASNTNGGQLVFVGYDYYGRPRYIWVQPTYSSSYRGGNITTNPRLSNTIWNQ